MNLLDLALALTLLAAVLGGLRAGFISRVLTWTGIATGALAATFTVPLVLRLIERGMPSTRFIVGIAVLAATVAVCTSVFQVIGARARAGVAQTPLSSIDRILGALAGGALVLAVTWFLLPAAAGTSGEIARQVRGSTIVSMVDTLAPTPPGIARDLSALVDRTRFPTVFDDLRPSPETGPPPEEIGIDAGIVDRSTAATVQVRARGCGRRYDGSGVVLGEDVIVTNAHVVAGADEVEVTRPNGTRRAATVVRFDADRDLAVLETTGLGASPLGLARAELGGDGVSIGYPGGQSAPRVAPLRVEDRRTATGRDIYGQPGSEREVLFLAAQLRQGDSGSPVIDANGDVVGIVFAVSPDRATAAYALDRSEVDAILAAPRAPGESGACLP
ncbi:MAG: MarP family serine protease [Nitriliruptoraceae bacterium]|nr:MarP family serine protease [Nitriliruptoraceae bacterium]